MTMLAEPISSDASTIDRATVWCAIPVYNNVTTIVDVVTRCVQQLNNVLVIDDGSTDADLRDVLKSLPVTVVRHDVNRGKGAALMTAFRHIAEHGGRYVITLDGDGQHFPEDVPRFLDRLAPATILVGHRREVMGTMPRASTFGREFSDFWIYLESGAIVRDTQSGFRAYPLPDVLELRCGAKHYNFEMEVITRAAWAGLYTDSVPIRVWYPDAAERVSSFHPVRDNWRISKIHLRLIGRQLWPIPHRRVSNAPSVCRTGKNVCPTQAGANTRWIGHCLAAAAGILPSIVLWPWGGLLGLYIAWRLHLSKAVVLIAIGLSFIPIVPNLSAKLGRVLMGDGSRLQWFIGSHAMAFSILFVTVAILYATRPRQVSEDRS